MKVGFSRWRSCGVYGRGLGSEPSVGFRFRWQSTTDAGGILVFEHPFFDLLMSCDMNYKPGRKMPEPNDTSYRDGGAERLTFTPASVVWGGYG